MIRLFLNLANKETFTIFDIDTGVRFNRETPFRVVPFVSETLKRSIKAGKIIDVDNVLAIELKPDVVSLHNKVLALAGITRQMNNSGSTSEVSNEKDIPIEKDTPIEDEEPKVEKEEKPKSKRGSKNKEEGDK